MHRPFVTTVKFENEVGGVMRLDYAVAAVDTTDAKTELERRFLDLEVDGYTIECWLHGSCFDLRTGQPTGLPATEPVPVYPVKIEGDDVYVAVEKES